MTTEGRDTLCKQCFNGAADADAFCSDTCMKRYDAELSPRRVFLIGEHNPYGSDPRFALYPEPTHSAGGRLCRLLGMQSGAYLHAFERRNLLTLARWSVPAAREAANRVRAELREGDALVLLGARVSSAFGYPFAPLAEHRGLVHGAVGYEVLVIPHPSGLSRAWNDPAMGPRVRAAVEALRAARG